MAAGNLASKLERAVWNYLLQQGKGTVENTYFGDFNGERILPNRTIVATSFSPKKKFRPEGRCQLVIEHHFPAVSQDENFNTQRVQKNEFVGGTEESMTIGDGQSYNLTADYITLAGRALAVSDGSPEGDTLAADNADMVGFRCDWIEESDPFLTRGRPNIEGVYWIEIMNFTAFVSNATIPN